MEHNSITLRGYLQNLPQFSHENHNRRFYKFILEVPRLSGAVDQLPVIVPEQMILEIDPTAGSMITVSGQIRSHNLRQDGLRHRGYLYGGEKRLPSRSDGSYGDSCHPAL